MDNENLPYDPEGIRHLVIAIMQQGVEDVLSGNPSAISWMNSRAFDHYCTWLGIDPTAAREGIEARRAGAQGRFSEADLQRVQYLRNNGVGWKASVIQVFGYYSETIRLHINDYNRMGNRPMEAA